MLTETVVNVTCPDCGTGLTYAHKIIYCERCTCELKARAAIGHKNAEHYAQTLILRAALGVMKEPICERVY